MVNRAGNNSDGFKEEANGMPIRLSIGQVAAVIMRLYKILRKFLVNTERSDYARLLVEYLDLCLKT